jgi:predicted nucleotidyltransferase
MNDSSALIKPIAHAFLEGLSSIVAVAAYGSIVTRDHLAGFSDLDVLVIVREPISVEDAIRLQRLMPEPDGVPYVQPSFRLLHEPEPYLVPGAFRVVAGELPDGFVATEEALLRDGGEVLRKLPDLVRDDARAWTGAINEKRPRHVRLMVTRLKPAVRATLVRLGEPVLHVWAMPWDELAARWRIHDPKQGASLSAVIELLQSPNRDDRGCGEAVLRLLDAIVIASA